MADDTREYKIQIGTEYEGGAAKEAIADEQALAAASRDAAQAGAEMRDSAEDSAAATAAQGKSAAETVQNAANLGVALKDAAKISRALSAAMRGSATSARGLLVALRGLWTLVAANPLTAMIAVFTGIATALGAWIRRSAEAREAIAKDIGDTVKANADAAAEITKAASQAHFDGLRDGLKAVADEFERANRAAAALLVHNAELEDAKLGAALANLDKEEQVALLKVQGSPVDEARVRADFSQRRVGARQESAQRKAAAEAASAQEEAQRIAAQQAALDEKTAAAKAETPAEAALRENRERVRAAAKELHFKTDEEQQLDELAALQKTRDERAKRGLSLGDTEARRLMALEIKEPQLRKAAETSTSFSASQIEAARGDAARIPEFRSNAAIFQSRAADANNPDRKMDERLARLLAAQLKKAETAKILLDGANQTDAEKELKDQAEANKKAREEQLKAAAAEQTKLAEARTANARRIELAQAKQAEVAAQADAEGFKTKTEGDRAIDEKSLEEKKRFIDAQIKAAQAALDGTDKLSPDYAIRAKKLTELEHSKVGLRLPGSQPTTVDTAMDFADRKRIDADRDKRLVAAADARQRAKEQQDREADKERAAWVKAGGPKVEAERGGIVSSVEAYTKGKFGNEIEGLKTAGAQLKGLKVGESELEAVVAALANVNAALRAIHTSSYRNPQLAAIERELAAMRRHVSGLEQGRHDRN